MIFRVIFSWDEKRMAKGKENLFRSAESFAEEKLR